MFRKLKIQSKIALTVALVFTIAYIVVFSIVLQQIYTNSKNEAETLTKATSISYAKDVTANLTVLKSIAMGLDSTIRNQMNAGYRNRDQIIELQKDILRKYPNIFGVTVAFETNEYDGSDTKYSKDSRFGAGGLFIPYVTRNGNGFSVQAAYDNTTDMRWYDIPKQTKKIFITEPTTYKVSGRDVSMASLVMPILDKSNRFMGVVSFDYQLGTFQSQIKAVKALGGGAFLISKTGMIIANGVDNTPLMSNITDENKSAWGSVLQKTGAGDTVDTYGVFTKDGDQSLLFAAPINVEGTETNWSLVNIIPVANVYANFYKILWTIIPIALIILILLIVIMVLVSGVISKGLKFAEKHLARIAEGDISADVDPRFLKGGDEVGNLCRTMQTITENLREKAVTAGKIADGDIHVTVTEKSDKDVLSQAMRRMIAAIDGLIQEATALSKAATEGNVEIRGDESRFKGGYREIIAGFNSTLDAVAEPINEVRTVINRISVNDYTKEVTGCYSGVFKDLADDTNNLCKMQVDLQKSFAMVSQGDTGMLENYRKQGKKCENDNMTPAMINMMQNIKNLIEEFERVSFESANGNVIHTRGNATLFEGGFQRIINGFNSTLDGISTPLTEMMTILNAMAVNDFTVKVSHDYKGDYKKLSDAVQSVSQRLTDIQTVAIKISAGDVSDLETFRKLGKISERDQLFPAFTQMMDAIHSLIEETTTIAGAAATGKLSVRADAGRFSGGYAAVLNEINAMLNAVEAPVGEVKRVMTAISASRLDERITGVYKGEFGLLADAVNATASMLETMITRISAALTRISGGDLSIQAVEDFNGDFAAISVSLNGILSALNELLGNISATSEQVAAGSMEVSQGSQSLSQGATEQASAVEQLTASVSEIAEKTRQNALDANEANRLITTMKGHAAEGSSNMDEMLSAMTEIGQASTNISKIIKVIDDIAFQTNILALNAAVEAARAGQYGKGFAVVAEEVRNLAAKSAEAAKETTALIDGSVSKVNNGAEIANQTAKALGGIVDGVRNVTSIMEKIASSSNEQATGIAQLDTGLQQVSSVTQTVSATSEQSAAASEELTSQADLLRQQVARFKLRQ